MFQSLVYPDFNLVMFRIPVVYFSCHVFYGSKVTMYSEAK